jgi:hypothetical protein
MRAVRDRTGDLIPDANTCTYCDRDSDTCSRIPGRCCGACSHAVTTTQGGGVTPTCDGHPDRG